MWQVHGLKRLRFNQQRCFFSSCKKKERKEKKKYFSSSIFSVFHAHIISPSVWIYFCLLCFLTESCKDILAATGNYAQPEVTTLTWRWLAMKRAWVGCGVDAVQSCSSAPRFVSFSWMNCRRILFSFKTRFYFCFFFLSYIPKTLWYKISCIADLSYLLSFYMLQTFCMCCMI